MIKSLRWRLQIWHAVVLTVVLAVFGTVVYNLHWQTRRQQIDADLDRKSEVLMTQLRRLLPSRGPGRVMPPFRSSPGASRSIDDRPQRDRGRPDRGPDPKEAPRDLPEALQNAFEGDDASAFYYIIWGREGQLLKRSATAPDIPYPALRLGPEGLPVRTVRTRVNAREVIHAQRFDINILVGRSIIDDLVAERRYGAWLFLVGSGTLACGLLGGAWLSDRAIRPIYAMTNTAQSISAQNLAERIDLTETDTELGQLAKVLNGAFDRLQGAFEQQSRFTADASHELRTPLSVILAHTELALSRARSNEEYRATLETCQRASLRMKALVEDLLMLARFDSGEPTLEASEFDLRQVILEAAEMLQPLAAARKIRLETDVFPLRVRADRGRISQVVTNLMTNAIRYNHDGGLVCATIANDPAGTLLQVTDTGIGIPQTELPYIFDRFYRVDKARSRSDAEGGSGLGLAICKTIVEAHGGTIQVTSQPGSGTTFAVRLPSRT